MPNYSSATIIGHLGKDPEQRGDFASVSVAVTTKKDRKPTWWRVSCFKKDGEALMRLHKGDAAMFVGTPELNEFADRDGVVKQTLELSFARVVFLGGKSEGAPKSQGEAKSIDEAFTDDTLPF